MSATPKERADQVRRGDMVSLVGRGVDQGFRVLRVGLHRATIAVGSQFEHIPLANIVAITRPFFFDEDRLPQGPLDYDLDQAPPAAAQPPQPKHEPEARYKRL